MRETLDGVLWIGLENCAYEREVRERPVLSELRLSCAEQFFDQQFSSPASSGWHRTASSTLSRPPDGTPSWAVRRGL